MTEHSEVRNIIVYQNHQKSPPPTAPLVLYHTNRRDEKKKKVVGNLGTLKKNIISRSKLLKKTHDTLTKGIDSIKADKSPPNKTSRKAWVKNDSYAHFLAPSFKQPVTHTLSASVFSTGMTDRNKTLRTVQKQEQETSEIVTTFYKPRVRIELQPTTR